MYVLAIDQFGQKLTLPGKHPRKELLDKLGYKHADKMLVANKDGTTVHCGYVVGNSWYKFYKVEPWERVEKQ